MKNSTRNSLGSLPTAFKSGRRAAESMEECNSFSDLLEPLFFGISLVLLLGIFVFVFTRSEWLIPSVFGRIGFACVIDAMLLLSLALFVSSADEKKEDDDE
jgi:hypothetical protein